ncbi:unnamed protein product [Psylliodes chrysocephalus]|uniref:Uncharacterized protein n=1 Tax=Psylliodes chrysocephalus TaxID=3402493 RepID=A0A9P0CY30_9CUCU|nr:unnamed protein product [Psylliodes chrysocephala]
MSRSKKALTLAELDEIMNDPSFMNDVESADIVVLPPEVDYLTDEDEADENLLGVVDVHDVPGELELQLTVSSQLEKKNDLGKAQDIFSQELPNETYLVQKKCDFLLTFYLLVLNLTQNFYPKPVNFETVKVTAKYDPQKDTFESPTFAMSISTSQK